jgi:hypothetical protein
MNCFHAATDKVAPLRRFFVDPGMSPVIPSFDVCVGVFMIRVVPMPGQVRPQDMTGLAIILLDSGAHRHPGAGVCGPVVCIYPIHEPSIEPGIEPFRAKTYIANAK